MTTFVCFSDLLATTDLKDVELLTLCYLQKMMMLTATNVCRVIVDFQTFVK